ncbi:unnamed protein product [Rhizophagus irregularis]|nr:unnamed protein product [Rhizophagus irregularis]
MPYMAPEILRGKPHTLASDVYSLDEKHPKAIYTSRLLNFQNLPEPINCRNQQEFVSSRYTKRIRTGQVNTFYSDECSDCVIMDID